MGNRPTAKDIPDHILDRIASQVVRGLDEFYRDPANEAAFQRWLAEREANHGGRAHE